MRMQVAKLLKVRVGAALAQRLELAVLAEGVAAAELVRRALYVYFNSYPVERMAEALLAQSLGGSLAAVWDGGESAAEGEEELQKGPWEGPSRALEGPAAAPPSSPPPSCPPAPPESPPSVSPPALRARSSLQDAPIEAVAVAKSSPAKRLAPAKPKPAKRLAPAEPPGEAAAIGLLFPPPPEGPPVLVFPCLPNRRGGPTEWALTADLVARWEVTFPGMDIVGEARKALEWVLAKQRKTYGGMRTYLFRWFCKAQDSGRFMRRAAGGGGAGPGASVVSSAAGPPKPAADTLLAVYGFETWEEWRELLRQYFTGDELARELAKLGEIQAEWEAAHGKPA
jgi:hypothetical protein